MIKRLFILLLLLLVALPTICLAAEITEQELEKYEQIFNQLEKNRIERERLSERVNILLKKSEEQITNSNKHIVILNEKLTIAEQSISQMQNSLERANRSLNTLKKEIRGKDTENFILKVIVGALLLRQI